MIKDNIAVGTRGLFKIYRVGGERVRALNGVDIGIRQGEFCCIVGQSGSGKSTLLNMLAGLEKPSKGTVHILYREISSYNEDRLAKFRQKHLGFIFQSYNLLPRLTAAENVALPLMVAGMPKEKRLKRARKVLDIMGLSGRANFLPTEMSGGQQQRVGIARAFAAAPKVIFADEPTGNLDTATTAQVLRFMIETSPKMGITLVMVTHEPELAACGDRIITLKDGQVIENLKLPEEEVAENRRRIYEQ
jgi:putative ABC transport system ATP-binding protein